MKGFAQTITRDSFPLPSVDGLLADARHELEYGRGFLLLRGLPIERYTDEEAGLLYRGIGARRRGGEVLRLLEKGLGCTFA